MTDAIAAGAPRAAPDRMVRSAVARPPLVRRLGFRLSLLLAVALLPLGVISLWQTEAWLSAAREQRAALLTGETLRVSAPVVSAIREAQGAAAALAAAVSSLAGDEAACDAALTRFTDGRPLVSMVGFVPLDGRMTCAANGRSHDYSGMRAFRDIVADLRPMLIFNARGPVSGEAVVLAIHPVPSGAGGAHSGYVAVALSQAALQTAAPLPADSALAAEAPPAFVVFDEQGAILTSSADLAALPPNMDLRTRATGDGEVFRAHDASGQERLYATVPLVGGELYAMGSVPTRDTMALGPVTVLPPVLGAALMWIGSLVVAWLASEWLVSRHIRRLSRAIGSFASGSRSVGDLRMAGAPAEIREAGQAFLRMADAILHDEAELEDTVHQREVLLREVHHRVKNNLQLIASIMNMQMRRARAPETRALMRGLQERVMSLATVHKELYLTSGLADVRADELLGDITRQIVAMASAPGRTFRIAMDFAPVPLTPDQAVPLSLLLTEALTNALKYAEPPAGEAAPRLDLRFQSLAAGRAELSIANSAGPARPGGTGSSDGTGLGQQLVTAFASQLGGEARVEASPGRYVLRVGFVLSSVRERPEGGPRG